MVASPEEEPEATTHTRTGLWKTSGRMGGGRTGDGGAGCDTLEGLEGEKNPWWHTIRNGGG